MERQQIGYIFEGMYGSRFFPSASVRLRALNIIQLFKNHEQYRVETYRPWRRYDLIIFLRRDYWALALAKRLKKNGAKVAIDINANLFDHSLYGKGYFKEFDIHYADLITEFCQFADYILVTSPYLKKIAEEAIPITQCVFLPEIIEDQFFLKSKDPLDFARSGKKLRFVYCGYAAKTDQLLLIQDTLEHLAKKYQVEYTLICERMPNLKMQGVQFNFVRYNQKTVSDDLCRGGDLFLAPRDNKDTYNLGHSFTKIGLPMSVGIPVIASPLPSYEGSPAIFCNDYLEGWEGSIEQLKQDPTRYQSLSENGKKYCFNHFSRHALMKTYSDFFRQAL